MKKTTFLLILIIVFITLQVDASTQFNCNSTQSGDRNNAATWINCDGGIPGDSNGFVTLKNGHSINLNLDSESSLRCVSIINGTLPMNNVSLLAPCTNFIESQNVTITSVCGKEVTVTNNLDSGPGSFRAAVGNVCDYATINFDDAYTINLLSTISINKDLVIDGSGQVFESAITDSLFNIGIDGFVRLNKVTIQNTNTDTGAITNFGTLTMHEAFFKNNNNSSENGGGAITNFGSMSLGKISFYQNNAKQGGAINNKNGSAIIHNSTFYQNGNLLIDKGGSIYNEAQLELVYITVIDSGNGSMKEGNSIYSTGNNSNLRLVLSIIASSNQSISECFASTLDQTGSISYLVDDGSCNAPFIGDPLIGEWGPGGGFSPTIPLLEGSPMINSGVFPFCSHPSGTIDQVGNPRINGISCDIGAIEYVDTSIPEIISVSGNNQTLNECANISEEINTIKITYSERVLNAENPSNYQLIHAGLDQSFQTADDIYLQAISAVSDGHLNTPTVTLSFPDNLNDGIVRLYVDSDITDEFFHQLYNGIDYEHQFRIELGNLIKGGHFDNCNKSADFQEWQIIGNSITASDDIDDSNASFSFKKLVTSTDPFTISQCINMNQGIQLNMDAYFKKIMSSTLSKSSKGENLGFNIEMSCIQFDEIECMGNILETLSMTENFSPENLWVNISNNLGKPNPLIKSAECKIETTPQQFNTYDFFIDKVRLFLIEDIIFADSFE